VACNHGELSDVDKALALRSKLKIPPSKFTLNILVDFYLSHLSNKSDFKSEPNFDMVQLTLDLATKWSLAPDTVTTNTLLKHCLRTSGMVSANKVISYPLQFNIIRIFSKIIIHLSR
jgi:hypothetical protein